MFSQQWAVQSLLTECRSDVHRHIKRFVFTLFGFTLFFVSCHFWCFEQQTVQRDNPSERRASESCKEKKKERSLAGSLIWSPRDIYAILFNESDLALTALTDSETRCESRSVYVRFNVSERAGLLSSPCYPTGTWRSHRASIRTFPDNLPWFLPWARVYMWRCSDPIRLFFVSETKYICLIPINVCRMCAAKFLFIRLYVFLSYIS